jgi:hypothetical protein
MIDPEETKDEERARLLREQEGRNVQHYMVLATAWVNTLMEHDKTIITLSSGAIGLLITILTTKGVEEGWHIALYVIAFIAYIATIIVTKRILKDNALVVENEIRETIGQAPIKIPDLKKFDRLADWSFIVGTIVFAFIGILTAVSKLQETLPKTETKPPAKAEIIPPKPSAQPQPTSKPGHRSINRAANPPEYRVIYLNCVQTYTTSSRNCRDVK